MEDLQLPHRKNLRIVNSVSPKNMQESFFEKPSLSYIALIAKAILSSPTNKLNLSSIYKYIEDNFPFYRKQEQGWRNSVRHNLSLNDCFIKVGRCEDGKGNYWSIHPANLNDFLHGDFRQHRKSRKHGCQKNVEFYFGMSRLPPWRTNYLQPGMLFRTHPYFMEPVWNMLYVSSTACRLHVSDDYQKWFASNNLMERRFSPAVHSDEPSGHCFDWCHGSYLSAIEHSIFLNVQQMLPNSTLFPLIINRQDIYSIDHTLSC